MIIILTQFIKRVDMAVKESTREALESFILRCES